MTSKTFTICFSLHTPKVYFNFFETLPLENIQRFKSEGWSQAYTYSQRALIFSHILMDHAF